MRDVIEMGCTALEIVDKNKKHIRELHCTKEYKKDISIYIAFTYRFNYGETGVGALTIHKCMVKLW